MKMVMLMLMLMMMVNKETSAETEKLKQNFCSDSTVLRTRTSCHACSISALIQCPVGFKMTPQSIAQDCTYSSLNLSIRGCSFECYKKSEVINCCPGFWGPDCRECPESADQPCNNRGWCSDGLGGNGTCTCQVGFTGAACEFCSSDRFGPSCSSVCSCVHGLCDSGLRGSGTCTCLPGYKGSNCDIELPECAAITCPPNSRCVEEALTGQLVCQCLHGYQKTGAQCLPVNPCLGQVCSVHATCVHTGPNQHLCTCNHGYSGDGHVCMAIDPCQSDLGGCPSESASCIYDGPGQSHCECLSGFESLPSGGCRLKDLCRPDSCHSKATCITVAPGKVKCTCLQGYHGNGKICYGNIMERLKDLNMEPGGRWSGQLSNAIALFESLSWPLQNQGPFTVFVPINKGFRGTSVKTLTADTSKAKYRCKMHLVAGVMPFNTLKKADIFYTLTGKSAEPDTSEGDTQTKIRLHGSRKKGVILQSDVVASNGMIHIISKLMDSVSATVESNTEENLLAIINNYGKFDKFKSLLEKANLHSELDQPGLITVFAPSNAAFDSMAEGHLQYLSSAEGHNKLVEMIRHHIHRSAALEVFDITSSPRVVTMANQVLTFNVTDMGQILVDGAAVLEAAVGAKNGRLYVLDGVLTPPTIIPVLPHRCDITANKVIKGECVSCKKLKQSQCPDGVYTGSSTFGCTYPLTIGRSGVSIPATGCTPMCNTTVTTPSCCKGFYGPDCRPCPGGFLSPCSGHGQCVDGLTGNGSCLCNVNFAGSRCHFCAATNKHGPNCDQRCPCVHGRCDNRPDSDGRCKANTCQSGFTGLLCDRRTRPCGERAQFCHVHAECDFSQGTTRCVCKPGYQGDGITCVETDVCAPPLRGGCSINAKCITTGPGTHTCQCLSGWKEDGDECQPINNCDGPDKGGCHSNATCIYVGPGQSDCSCKSGFKGNGHECEAVNQCVTLHGGCHYLATCRLLSSLWTCVCDEGYIGDGHVCYGSIKQELMSLPDASEFFTWLTDSNLLWTLSDQNLTVLVPSSAAVSRMSSDDRIFWTAKGNLQTLIRNHIIPGVYPSLGLSNTSCLTSLLKTSLPVSTTNELTTVGGATITTWDLAATNGLIHVIDQVLVPDRKLSEGLLAVLALQPDFSLFRSFLIEYNLTDEIEQSDGFTVFAPTDGAIKDFLKKTSSTALDVNTTRYHVVVSERLLKTDLQLGGYRQTMLGLSYQLRIGPRDGKLFVNEAQVNALNVVIGRGVIHGVSAVLPITRNRCDVIQQVKVTGNCVDCFFPQNKVCPSNTKPDRSLKRRKCRFARRFEGELQLMFGCITTCLEENIVRQCCAGFFGPHCEPCPGPASQPCSGSGFCDDGVNGSGLCRCDKGFNGTACETCLSGKYGVHCDQDCGCKQGRCDDGPTGDGTCHCDVGWRGILCDEKIESGSELCGGVKCHTSANCVIRPSGHDCVCAAGFQGNGTFCQAKDPCAENNGGCSLYAICKRTLPGRRDCVCDNGYHGDGLVCVEINPCLEENGGCHANADCIHVGPNKTSCVCSEGYAGDGVKCKMIDLCLKKNGGCSDYALCNTTAPGVRTCRCHGNFVGDGLTCRGTVGKEILKRKLRDFYLSLMMLEIPLNGRGPFTVFAPNTGAFADEMNGSGRMKSWKKNDFPEKSQEKFAAVLRSHIVMCHTLLALDLSRPRNITSLSGHVLTTRAVQGKLFVNEANVTYSDDVSVNGIFHEINKILFPPNLDKITDISMNLTDVADRHGYKTFYKLLQDSGVMALLNDTMFQPLTVFLPSDDVMASLPQQQKDFLFHRDHRAQLLEYLKYHVLQSQKIYAEGLIHLESARTLQGSLLSFTCGGTDAIGEIFVNDGKCRIVQRHLVFRGGIAYGIDCLLTPPSLGGRCDEQTTMDMQMSCSLCTSSRTQCPQGFKLKEVKKCDLPTMFVSKNTGCRSTCTVNFWQPKCCHGYYGRDCLVCPGGVGSPCSHHGKCDDGHLGNGTCSCEAGFGGVACELCSDGFYGPTCTACDCSGHGSCDSGRKGTGSCFCDAEWMGERCEKPRGVAPVCSPACSPNGVCQENNTCVCRPFYEGDGFTCTVIDMCQVLNGGCFKGAQCSQSGDKVSCTCPKGYQGDGFTCLPVDPCIARDNGGCHEHAVCTMTAPGRRKCTCKENYIGDGLTCELTQLPISRCLQGNGQCHQDAKCTDLHFEDATLGVFHWRSARGQYKLTYSEAAAACAAEGARLASYTELSYAQKGGLNVCAAGWLDQARVAYPTTFSSLQCGFGHVGIVDYGTRKNLSEMWDSFCFRMKEVKCECKPGYLGDGFSCTGNLLRVLESTPSFSNFLIQILNVSSSSESGKQFVKCLENMKIQSTLFVPDNNGLLGNQTLSQRDVEFHLLEGQALPLSELKNGSRIRTKVGALTVVGVANLLDPSALVSRYINDRFIIESDIVASNGIIHVLQGPLTAPPPRQEMHVAHQAGVGVGVLLLSVVVVVAVVFVGFNFYRKNNKPFRFHYFKDEEEATVEKSPNVSNPVYEAAPEPDRTKASDLTGEHEDDG